MLSSFSNRASARLFYHIFSTGPRLRKIHSDLHLLGIRSFSRRLSPFEIGRTFPQTRTLHIQQSFRPNLFQSRFRPPQSLRHSSTKTSPHVPPTLPNNPEPTLTISQRLKKLSREYGWTAVGVYLALSALDFPFCFLAVRLLGTERIGRWESAVVDTFWSIISIPFPSLGHQPQTVGEESEDPVQADVDRREGRKPWDHGVAAAQKANEGDQASIWTQLALAYAVHKSFIFIRVPLTAAVLPKVVKTLRAWGWKVGRRTSKKS